MPNRNNILEQGENLHVNNSHGIERISLINKLRLKYRGNRPALIIIAEYDPSSTFSKKMALHIRAMRTGNEPLQKKIEKWFKRHGHF
jgi:hypothetical protein